MRGWAAVGLVLFVSACQVAAPDSQDGSDPLERLLILEETLKDINQLINLGNDAYTTSEALFSTPGAYFGQESEKTTAARDAWEAVEEQVDSFREDQLAEVSSLERALEVIDATVPEWLRLFELTERTGGTGLRRTAKIFETWDELNERTADGMGMLTDAAEQTVREICEIDENAPACFLNSPPTP